MPRRNQTKQHSRLVVDIPCKRKKRFNSEAKALETAEQATEVTLKVYKCPYCKGWHLSSAV